MADDVDGSMATPTLTARTGTALSDTETVRTIVYRFICYQIESDNIAECKQKNFARKRINPHLETTQYTATEPTWASCITVYKKQLYT